MLPLYWYRYEEGWQTLLHLSRAVMAIWWPDLVLEATQYLVQILGYFRGTQLGGHGLDVMVSLSMAS